jgi:hypothetical protein
MPNSNTSAASAALAAKRAKKKGRLCLKRRQQLERELRKKQKEEAAVDQMLCSSYTRLTPAVRGLCRKDFAKVGSQSQTEPLFASCVKLLIRSLYQNSTQFETSAPNSMLRG